MIKAVVFDLDDTLISEFEYIKSGYFHVSKILSSRIGKCSKEMFELLIDLFNKNPKNVFNRAFEHLKVTYTNNEIIELVDEYRNHYPRIQFFDDVLPCLKELKKQNIKIGIITDGYSNAQRQKLKAVEAHHYFDDIIITDELGKEYWKPHPKAFEIMKEKLEVNFTEMIYIGDNPEKDFYISTIYPIKTIRICRKGIHKDKEYLHKIKEDFSVKTLNDLKPIIDKLNRGYS